MKTETCIVVIGLDADQKPRAAKFDVADEKTVRKAAAAQGLKIGRPKTDEAIELALKLVDGKIYSSGKGLMPLVNSETYEKLLKLLEIEDPKTDAATVKPSSPPKVGLSPGKAGADPWSRIIVGTVVLYPDGKGITRSWWECTVAGISSDAKTLTLRWTHYPKEKPFAVKRAAVAIVPCKG